MAAFQNVLSLWTNGSYAEGFSGGETFLDVEKRLRDLHDRLWNDGSGHVMLVGHCLIFMAFIWLFCDNRGPTLEAGHMGRGHLSILRGTSKKLSVEEFDIPPPA